MDFDKNKYKVWRLPHPILIHWLLNPALAFNELILGQRLPKITLIDKTSDGPLMERQFVPCPHCGTVHNGLLWAKQDAFMNWFGYLCPKCEQIIPCLWNLTSLVLLTISFPIWGWFRRPLESKWRRFKKNQLIKNKDVEPVTAKNTSWIKMGLFFGLLMFCMMLLAQLIDSEITSTTPITQFLICLAAGLAFGGMMKCFLSLKKNII
jgi:hypothetical protein